MSPAMLHTTSRTKDTNNWKIMIIHEPRSGKHLCRASRTMVALLVLVSHSELVHHALTSSWRHGCTFCARVVGPTKVDPWMCMFRAPITFRSPPTATCGLALGVADAALGAAGAALTCSVRRGWSSAIHEAPLLSHSASSPKGEATTEGEAPALQCRSTRRDVPTRELCTRPVPVVHVPQSPPPHTLWCTLPPSCARWRHAPGE